LRHDTLALITHCACGLEVHGHPHGC
jgi:hypothetical protein